MSKFYTRLKWHFPILTLLIATAVIFHACKKQEPLLKTEAIDLAKNWFIEQNIKFYYPDWPSAKNLTIGDNQYLAVPTNLSYSGKDKITSLLLVDVTDRTAKGYLIELINTEISNDDYSQAALYKSLINRDNRLIAENLDGNALLFTPKHEFIDGWHATGNILIGKFKENPKTLKDRLKMSLDNEMYDCSAWYYIETDAQTGEILSMTYLYTLCEGTTGGGNGNGGGGAGNTNPPAPSPKQDSLNKIMRDNCLNTAQLESLQTMVSKYIMGDGNADWGCLRKKQYDFLVSKGAKFGFCIDNNLSTLQSYNPQSRTFKFQDENTLNYSNFFEHEFFHGFQDFSISGGSAQYAARTSSGGYPDGYVNIEFETALYQDVIRS